MFSPSNPAQSLARDIALLESPRCPDSIAIKIEQSQLEGKEPVAYKLPRILQSNTTLRKLDLSGSCFIDQYAIEVMHDKPKHEELPPVNSTTVFFFPQQGRTHSVWGYMVIDPKQPSTLNGAIL
ncbi:MAG: hypothetical protein KAT71_05305, partial [Gammaproteobacteria bacterium]|nr:hypothetical protein [Gammaproteobacteria bacterium]